MFPKDLKQSTLYGSILTQETLQDTIGRNGYTLYLQFTLNLHYP